MEELMEGYLEKKSTILGRRWKKHWFVLRGRTLSCFKSQEEADASLDAAGKVFLDFKEQVQLVRPSFRSPKAGNRFTIEIITNSSSTLKLAASNEPERRKWLNGFHLALCSGPSISAPIQRKCSEDGEAKEKAPVDGIELDQLRLRAPPTCFSPTASVFFTSEQFKNWPRLSMNLYDEVVEQVNSKLLLHESISHQNTQTDFPSDDEQIAQNLN